MPVAHADIHRLDDVMRARMQRGRHMRELVEHIEVGNRRPTAHVLKIAQEGRAGHRHEDRMFAAEGQAAFGIAGAVGEARGDRRDQLAHQPTVEMDAIPSHIRPGAAPVRERDLVTKDNAHILEDPHRGRVDAGDLALVHRLAKRQVALERGQHREIRRRALGPSGRAAAAAMGLVVEVGHGASRCRLEKISGSSGKSCWPRHLGVRTRQHVPESDGGGA